jgi:hypothetical protein
MKMRLHLRLGSGSLAIGVLLVAGCLPDDAATTGRGGAPGGGDAGAAGSSSTGSAGTAAGGSGAPAGAAGASTTGVAGAAAGANGAAAGAGGAPVTTGGRGGAAGRGGATGAAGRGGTTGAAGSASAGTTGTGGAGAGDDFVTGVTITQHANTRTILVVTWMQARAADTVWLEFTFPGGSTMTSRPQPGVTGAHRDVVLGVPGSTNVTVRIVNKAGTTDYKTRDYTSMTGAVPTGTNGMPVPTIVSYDASIASPERWMFGAVENSQGGCTNTSCYYHTTFWVYIMDRQGRIVWYYADAASNATSSFQRIARDGDYIWIEKRPFSGSGTRSVLKMTLDRQYSQTVAVPNLSDCIDVTTDGSLLYDAQNELREMNKAGTIRTIWSCRTAFGSGFQCYSNTINWDPVSDTVLMSFPDENTVAQINRATGALIATYGDRTGSYTFQPTSWAFEFQHFPNITAAGTLILSSHMPGYSNGTMPVANQHAFMEFEIDRTNRRLVEKWIYKEGPEWAMYKGMAIRLSNGNTLGNYGTGGAIREITPDKRTAFHVKFDAPAGNDFFNKMVGHNVLINDLYALNGGGPK